VAEQLARLYAPVRLFVNAFQPSFKLAKKTRDGARVTKHYHKPLTPCDRLLSDARVAETTREHIVALRADLDPVRLLAEIRSAQQTLITLADAAETMRITASTPEQTMPIDTFVSGLRTAWQDGEIRPTLIPKPKAKRGRRRPDPLVAVTEELRAWFDADRTSTGSQLLERLQETYPGRYPDGLLRTVQRRLKIWRREIARALVFGRAGQGALHQVAEGGNARQVHPAGLEHGVVSTPSRYSLSTTQHASRSERRPTLTTSARAAWAAQCRKARGVATLDNKCRDRRSGTILEAICALTQIVAP
jgi:hypothetical protein